MQLEHVNCGLCEADDYRLLKKVKSLYSDELFNLARCRRCGLVYVNPRQAEEEKIPYLGALKGSTPPSERDRNIPVFFRIIEEISRYVSGGRMLDIGCDTGTLLNMAKQAGWRPFGVELNKAAVEYAVSRYGLEVFSGELSDASFPESEFDVVTLLFTIEHIYHPKDLLIEINRILKPGGIIYLTTPNYKNIAVKLAQMMGFLNKKLDRIDPTGHPYIFTCRTMEALLEKTGFKPIMVSAGSTGDFLAGSAVKRMLFAPAVPVTRLFNIGSTITAIAKKPASGNR